MLKYLILAIQLFVFPLLLFSQGGELIFSHLRSEHGLSDNIVHSVIQDHEGFLWIGTSDGLNRYDGYESVIFRHDALDTGSISSNTVFKLFEDSKKRLWVGGSTGVSLFQRETMSFRRIPLYENADSVYYSSYTRAIIESSDSTVYIANTMGIYSFDEELQAFVRFEIDVPDSQSAQLEGIRCIHIDKKNRVWIGSVRYGLYIYDLEMRKPVVPDDEAEISNMVDRVYVISEDEAHNVWLGTNRGIFIVNTRLTSIKPLELSQNGKSLSIDDVWDIKFEDNFAWIATDGRGLIRYNRNDESLVQFLNDEYKDWSISRNTVRSICFDGQGLIWLGSFYGGVDYAQYRERSNFGIMRSNLKDPNSLSHSAVCAIYESSSGDLWIGTDGGGLDRYNAAGMKLAHFSSDKEGLKAISGNSVLAIDEDSRGNIWIGGYRAGVNIINPKTGVIKWLRHDPANNNSLSSDNVWGVYVDEEDIAWITTNEGGLNRYDFAKDEFTHFKSGGSNALVTNWSIRTYPDSRGNLWIGTYNGFSIFNPETEQFTNYAHAEHPGSLSNNWVYTFAEDSSGNMWIGTANGLNYFDLNTQQFKVYKQANGLPSDVINGLLFDEKHNLWISTNGGLTQFNPSTEHFRLFNQKDGLQSDQFIHGSFFMNKHGKMYFGGQRGLNSFYPDSIKLRTYKPPVFLTNLMLNFKKVQAGAEDSPLKKAIHYTDVLSLSHQQSTFTIEYTAIDFVNSTKIQFAYLLEGYDKEWNIVGDRREATYTNLDQGSYVFRVRASNDDDLLNGNEASIVIKVLPPWWNTWVFRISLTLLILLLAFALYRIRVRDLRNKKIQLEKEVDKRTSQIKEINEQLRNQADELNASNIILEERQRIVEEQSEELLAQKEELVLANNNLKELNSTKDKFLSIIAHDLKNPFGTIVGFAEIFRDRYAFLDDERKLLYIESIYDAATNVMSLLDKLLDWARSQSDQVKLIKVRIPVEELLRRNVEFVKEMAKAKDLKVKYKVADGLCILADSNMTDTILRNLITNAIKFSEKENEILVSAQDSGESVQFSVADNGIGIPAGELKGIFNIDTVMSRPGTGGESGSGLGLTLCKEYVEKHGGVIWAESVEYRGSTFYFTLPNYTGTKA